jgi:hypothetical protein
MSFLNKIFNGSLNKSEFLIWEFGTSVKVAYIKLDSALRKVFIISLAEANVEDKNYFSNPDVLLSAAQSAFGKLRGVRGVKRSLFFLNGGNLKLHNSILIRERQSPSQKIDQAEFKNLLERAEWQAFEEIKQANLSGMMTLPKIIEVNVREFNIDGYRVAALHNFKGRTVSIKLSNYFITRSDYAALMELTKRLKLEVVGLISSLRAQAVSQYHNESHKDGFIMIDIGERNTDVGIFRHGFLEGMNNFDVGGGVLIDAICNEFGITEKEAEAFELAHQAGSIDEAIARRLEKCLKLEVELLRKGIFWILNQFRALRPFPNLILLNGGGARFGAVKRTFSQTSWYQPLSLRGRIKVKVLVPADLENVIDKTNVLMPGPQSVPLAAAANFALAFQEARQSDLDRTLERIVKLLDHPHA